MYANESIDDLLSKLIQDSKIHYEHNDEVFKFTHQLVNNYSSDTIQLILNKAPQDQFIAFALSYFAFYTKDLNPLLASKYIATATDIAERYNDPKLWYWIYRHQGFLYQTIKKYEEALESFNRSNGYAITLNFERGRIINLVHLSEIHHAQP